MTATELEIRGVLIPLHGNYLLLPNVTIADVIGFRPPEPVSLAPEWLLGEIQWHSRRFPLVSFEQALGTAMPAPGHRARIVICYTLTEDSGNLPYVGIVAKGIPRLTRVTEENIRLKAGGTANPLILRQVSLSGQQVIIPDLVALENIIVKELR